MMQFLKLDICFLYNVIHNLCVSISDSNTYLQRDLAFHLFQMYNYHFA